MRGDFARVTFDPLKHYTQVLQHQGRVNLEADWNEQGAIVLHLLRSLIVDLGGLAWRAGDGFTLGWDPGDKSLTISKGHFYVDGVLCENDADRTFSTQPFLPVPDGDPTPAQNQFGLVYLDAWERLITSIEAPDLLEIALGGRETTSRAQVVWQVRTLDADAMTDRLKLVDAALAKRLDWAKLIKDDALTALLTANRTALQTLATTVANTPGSFKVDDARAMLASSANCGPMMRAKAKAADTQADLCTISPESRFRGLENQLYRVEVHDGGAGDGKASTFKWSRENGSVVFPIVEIDADGTKTSVTLADLGRDARLGLCSGDWVEFVDDDIAVGRQAHPLAKVLAVDRGALTVRLDIAPPALNLGKHPLLRRWDQQERLTNGVIPITESGQNDDGWLPIEDGISVAFEPGGLYATGDYWVIPARVESGDIEWPSVAGDPSTKRWLPPRGVTHHLAALGILRKSTTNITDGALGIDPLAK